METKSKFKIEANEFQRFFKAPSKKQLNDWRARCLESSESETDKRKFLKILDKWESQALN